MEENTLIMIKTINQEGGVYRFILDVKTKQGSVVLDHTECITGSIHVL